MEEVNSKEKNVEEKERNSDFDHYFFKILLCMESFTRSH